VGLGAISHARRLERILVGAHRAGAGYGSAVFIAANAGPDAGSGKARGIVEKVIMPQLAHQ
jgi:hypothetical protein